MRIHTAHPILPCTSPFASTRPDSPSKDTLPLSACLLPARPCAHYRLPTCSLRAAPGPRCLRAHYPLLMCLLSATHMLAIHHSHARYPPPTRLLPTTLPPRAHYPPLPPPPLAPTGAHNTCSIRAHYLPPTRSLTAAPALTGAHNTRSIRAQWPSPVFSMAVACVLDGRRLCAQWPPPVCLSPAARVLITRRLCAHYPLPMLPAAPVLDPCPVRARCPLGLRPMRAWPSLLAYSLPVAHLTCAHVIPSTHL
ncbi:hypothetical protein B0H14DRAFT_3458556 [Mycena olivaceomarginata]|nr:hypothetical protein B0H14DRAFT_3458556 [Mycena olivaceomarginata]